MEDLEQYQARAKIFSCFLTGFWKGCVLGVFSSLLFFFFFHCAVGMLLEDAIQKWAAYFG